MANDPEVNIDITIGHAKLAASAKKAVGVINEIGQAAITASGGAKTLASSFREFGDSGKSLPALRYALYDIRNTLSLISVAFAAVAIAPVALSIKYERAFANVIRTNELVVGSTQELRAELQEITESTPISWEDITNIAALAGQLGIAEKYIASFTESVAKFAATTDLTVDAAATAFGRLNQLIDGVDGQFEKLGSAILAVGISSVSTESEIVSVSTQIASMGNLAGLTAPEIIGLSGAMASVGIKPELARGNVTRLFSNIGKSAVEGGRGVTEFGRLTGRTAEEFVSDWGTQPGRVLQDFFRGINDEGPRAERTLRELGITSVRDIPAILRLAQTSDEVAKLIGISNDEFLRGSKINQQYGIISDTTAEQVSRLGQNVQTLGAAFGDSVGPLGGFLKYLNQVVQGLTVWAQHPIGEAISGFIIITSLLIAAFTALFAAVAGAAASILAIRFALQKLGFDSIGAAAKVMINNKAIDGLAFKSKFATIAVLGLSAAFRALLISTGIGAVLLLISWGLSTLGKNSDATSSKLKDLYGDMESLSTAIDEDTAAFDKNTGKMKDGSDALRVYTRTIENKNDAIKDSVNIAGDFVHSDEQMTASTEDGTAALEKQTRVIDENTVAYFKNQLLKDEDIVDLFSDAAFQDAMNKAGVTVSELIAANIEGESSPLTDAISAQLDAGIEELKARRQEILVTHGDTGPEYAAATRAIHARKEMAEEYEESLLGHLRTQADSIALDKQATEALTFANEGQQDAKTYIDLTDASVKILMEDIFGLANANKKTTDSFRKLGEEFADLGPDAGAATGAIQGVIAAVIAGTPDAEQQIINLAQAMLVMEAAGVLSSKQAVIFNDTIEGLGITAGITTARVLELTALGATEGTLEGALDALMDGMNGVGASADKASGKVKTLAEQFEELVDVMFDAINLGRETEEAIFALGEAFGDTGKKALYSSEEMQDAIGAILQQSESAEEGVANLASLFAGLAKEVGGNASPSLSILRQAISRVASEFGITEAEAQRFIDTAGDGIANINFDNFNRGIKATQEKIRTLSDYAGDLENVFSRAFDLRFAKTFDIDRIAEAWDNLGDNVERARLEVEDLQAAQQGLGADRAIKMYFLSVAESYGDMLRAAVLRKELLEMDRDQAENAGKLANAQAIAGGDLTGQGVGQRQNRSDLLGLVRDYQGYIETLAESGASQDELRKATVRARREFVAQAIELGYQESVVNEYAKAFDDVRTAIDRVPRNITVEANVNPALQALNELNASLQRQITAANDLNRALGQPVTQRSGNGNGSSRDDGPKLDQSEAGMSGASASLKAAENSVRSWASRISTLSRSSGQGPQVAGFQASVASELSFAYRQIKIARDEVRSIKDGYGFKRGGFTGRGNANEFAGSTHKGEYIVPKQHVNQNTGLPDASFLAQLQSGMRNFSIGSGSRDNGGDGTMMVELSPYDRKLLVNAGNVQLKLNGKIVAEATNSNNLSDARRGSN